MLKPTTCILILLLVISFTASSQIKVNVAGRQYNVPAFKDGSVAKPSYLEHISIPEPIEQSRYDIEIRYYRSAMITTLVNAWVIKGNTDSLFAETYEISQPPAKKTAKEMMMRDGTKYYVYYKKWNPSQLLDTALANFITHKLFVIQDQHQVYMYLKKRGVKINYTQQPHDCCLDTYIEVKLKNHVRSFTYSHYPAEDNPQVQQLADENILMSDFYGLINKLNRL